MLTHTATIRGRAITWDHREVVQHGLNADRVELSTDREWQECDRIVAVLAKAGLAAVRIDASQGFAIPSALMEEPGPLRMCLLGYVGGDTRIVTAKEDAPLAVVESGEVAGMDPAPEQPDLWAQLMEEVRIATEGAKTAAQSASKAESDLRAAAERGDFDGKDGAPGKTPVRGVDYWTAEDRKPIEDATLAATTAAGRADAAAATATEGEASRVAAETERADAETARVIAERARGAAETGRVEAEATRAANETKRGETFNSNLTSWNGKVDEACKKATDTASKAAQDAKTATDAAIAKTVEATNAAVAKADKATASATTAANKAEAAVAQLPVPSGNVLKGEAESTFINLHDSWKAPILKGKVLGQSNQITTKGINLLPNCEAKETKDFPWGLHPTTPLTFKTPLPAGQYTVSVECGKAVNLYYKEPGNAGTSSSSYTWVSITAKDGNRMKATFTADKPIGALYFYYACEGKHSIAQAQIEAGAKATAYEPYTGGKPSPSPDYPQEITNLNKAEIVVSGKNLLEQPKSFYNCGYAQGKPNAYTSSMVTLPFTTQAESNGIGFTFGMKQGITYTVSIVNVPKFAYSLRVGQYKQQKDIYSHASLIAPHVETNQKPSLTFTAVDNGVALVMLGGKWTNGSANVGTIEADIRFQVEVGNQPTSYKPYTSKSTPIDLKGNELCSLPNGVKDEVVIDAEGNVSLIKRIASIDCKNLAMERLQRQANGKWVAYKNIPGISGYWQESGAKSNKLLHKISLVDASEFGNFIVGDSGNLCFGIPENLYPQTANSGMEITPEVAAWFEKFKQDLMVHVQATNPQVIPLGKVELPALPEATSNIWNNGNIPANVYIQYLKDVNIAYSDLENQIKQITAALSMIDTPTVIPEI